MTTLRRSFCILPLLLFATSAHLFDINHNFLFNNEKKIMGPHELFGDPFGNPNDYKGQNLPGDFDIPKDMLPKKDDQEHLPVTGTSGGVRQSTADGEAGREKAGNTKKYRGRWELVSKNSGVSAMHSILLPKVNKVLMYDATIWLISNVKLPGGECRILNNKTGEKDCWAHSVLYDIETSKLEPLMLHTDTWCSSGGLTLDGDFVSTGGYQGGANTVRYLSTCKDCTWREYPPALAAPRWYSTQAELEDGGFIVVGGRDAFSYEYIPPEGKSNAKPYFFEFLRQTSNKEENNLYPFVYLNTDGNVFIFANSRSVLLNPKSNKIVREFPELPGGHRNYPASGMSAILPITLTANNPKVVPAEVLICGGSAHEDSYSKAEKHIFYSALRDCGRLKITEKNPDWERELMPTPRIMGDMIILPTGHVLVLNGAMRGASGWGFAREPNLAPVLYNPKAKLGKRFRKLTASSIPRMYHSSSVLLPDGKVLVAGSNTNNGYIYDAMYPTELRVEKFSPPYLDPQLVDNRPQIQADNTDKKLSYGKIFKIRFTSKGSNLQKSDIMVTIYAPAFTTHGVSMNQRLILLHVVEVKNKGSFSEILTLAPPSGAVAPRGYYMLYVVHKEVPSVSIWVQIK
ncbi:hypothetical protein K2173_023689 [Erythroxylum novogranatense]|uniref:Galactose oxidase n=1 Tax=Erythroxylum novogranatense TaxID=1862640 RepID=A0AAV8TR96_9ROSI|nr:hypothetical protein K2173_023689 [Erythroxylum novogranatense]